MEWIDSHCHLEKALRAGRDAALLERARDRGVAEVITIGTSLKDWEPYRALAQKYPGRVHWTVGIHPCSVDDGWQDALKAIPSFFATEPRPVALGEIGLDHFHLPKFPDEAAEVKARQAAAFRAQLELAYQLECPVVVHSRGAFEPCVRLIDESGVNWSRVVFHCFTEGPEEVAALNERGGRASFTGIVTYKNMSAEGLRAAALRQGTVALMVETDAPYLTPEPHRGQPNEPAFVRETGEFLAGLFGMVPEELARLTTANTRAFFGLEQ